MNISVLIKIVGKSRSWSTFSENLALVNTFGKIDLGRNFTQILGLVKNFRKMSIRVKNFANTISTPNLVKFVENLDFGQNYRKCLILVKI